MSKVDFRIVRSDGQEFLIDNKNWMILSDGLENWCNQPIQVNSEEAAILDGGFIHSVRIESIDRSITAQIADARFNEEARAELLAFFSPRYTFTAHITYQGQTRWCEGVQMGFKCEPGNIYKPIEFTWTIFCSNPFLMSEDDFAQDIAAIDPRFGFPLGSLLPAGTTVGEIVQPKCVPGFIVGSYAFNPDVVIYNDGDTETQFRAVIEANGEVKNPKIEKDGKFVRVLTTLQKGDVLDIDFTKRPPTVRINRKNKINLCDRKSNFTQMDMKIGKNVISYNADAGQANMSVTLYWNKRYLGI